MPVSPSRPWASVWGPSGADPIGCGLFSTDVDLVIDDLTLESASFIPDSIKFVAHNDFEFVQGYATYASDYDSSVRLRVKGLHVQASDIAYWFHKKVSPRGVLHRAWIISLTLLVSLSLAR